MMLSPGCLRNRSRLGSYADGALQERARQAVESHLSRCLSCRREIDRLARLRLLSRAAIAARGEPDWAGFWPAVRSRIAREAPRPIRDSWWLPAWKPFWGHPRISVAGAVMATLVLTFGFWPGRNEVPVALGASIVVQDVGTDELDGGVMVYSNPGDVTVIWVFAAEAATN
jgi:anti-sigma factor RsiW